jgi:DNA polymerase-3 subunit delta
MIIKYQALNISLKNNIQSIYVLSGHSPYLLNDAALTIKKSWRKHGETDEKIIDINSPSDWKKIIDEAYSYSLFNDLTLLDIRFDKKSIDNVGKEVIKQYLLKINKSCLIIIRASLVPPKQLQFLASDNNIVLVQIPVDNEISIKEWITKELRQRKITHEKDITNLIYQYSQGNMLAASQFIEKLTLILDPELPLTTDEVKAQLHDQSTFQLYDISDACLSANKEQVIYLLRQAKANEVEPTLILWILFQEVRLLIELSYLLKKSISFTSACGILKIWPKKTAMYEKSLKRLNLDKLTQLLHDGKELDELIKTSKTSQIWSYFENLALSLCS